MLFGTRVPHMVGSLFATLAATAATAARPATADGKPVRHAGPTPGVTVIDNRIASRSRGLLPSTQTPIGKEERCLLSSYH